MAFTREQSLAALASLDPATVFLDSYRIERLPENLDIYFGPPEEFFLAPDTQVLYTNNRLIPILDDGNFGVVTFLDPDTRDIVLMGVEFPDESRTTFRNWQQYLAALMICIGESVEEDERVRQIAKLVGFSHLDALFAFFGQVHGLGSEAWRDAKRKFLSGIPCVK